MKTTLSDGVVLHMIQIPAGEFLMGSPADEPGRRCKEGPQHLVQLEEFLLGQTPITQSQWRAVMGSNPSIFAGAPESNQRPVERVTWYDAMEFCQRLSQRTGRQFTLPSEAQWEYACRAGTTTPFHFGDTLTPKQANYRASETYGDGPKGEWLVETTPVGMFPANAWGLHDMHGNVWEWCLDDWHKSYEGAPSDGRAWLEGNDYFKLLRGGSWYNNPGNCRSAFRFRDAPVNRISLVGFRVCCSKEQS